MKRLLLLLGAAALLVAAPAFAQYVYLDVDGNGICNNDDVLTDAVTSVDVWFDTDSDGNGTPVICSDGTTPISFFSYEFILSHSGSVTYGAYTNHMATMTIPVGPVSGGNEIYLGFLGSTLLAPGAYKVGTMAVSVTPATTPVMSIVSTTTLGPYQTAFGSGCVNPPNYDGTYLLGRDFNDACGTYPLSTAVRSTTWGAIKNIYK